MELKGWKAKVVLTAAIIHLTSVALTMLIVIASLFIR